jgi:Putative esterase
LIRDGATTWSPGKNCLAVATSGAPLEIHPFFREDTRCSVCELMPPLADPSGVEHRLRVFLPPGYHENTLKRYPVLYMHDGHNLFLKEEAFVGNTWRTDEVLNMLDKMNAIEEVIVVGIHPHDRMNEYTMPGYENYGPVSCRKAKAADRSKISYATRSDNDCRHGLLARRRCFILSWMAMAEGLWKSCVPFEHIHLPG